jgi:dTMP kinase
MPGDRLKGMLVVIEGVDGTGKNTQRKLLEDHLKRQGLKVVYYHYPDYDHEYGRMLMSYLYSKIELTVKELFLLYLADMVKDSTQVERQIEEGNIVIMDRYFFSTIAYQSASGFDYEHAKQVQEIFGLRKPDIAFHIDLPIELAMERKNRQRVIEEHGQSDRHERDFELQENVRIRYRKLVAEGFGARKWVIVDGSKTPEEIHKAIADSIDSMLAKASLK